MFNIPVAWVQQVLTLYPSASDLQQLPIPNLRFKMSKTTMKAVVFKEKLVIRIEDRPIPKIIDPTDIIVKVRYSALCGR
jgi:hypothetical protein